MVGEEVARRSGANNRGTDLEDGLLPKLPDPVFGEEFHGCRDLPLIDGAEERVDLGRSNLEVASITGIESRLRFDYLAASRRDDWGLQTAGQTARLIAPTGRLFVRRRRLRLCSRRNQTSDVATRTIPRGVNGRPDYLRRACEGWLQRLGVAHIDFYYVHRVDPATPIDLSRIPRGDTFQSERPH